MDFITNNIWFIRFATWGLPLGYSRSKIVYQTDSWIINIKAAFWKETKRFFENINSENQKYKRFRNFYLFYLIIYLVFGHETNFVYSKVGEVLISY